MDGENKRERIVVLHNGQATQCSHCLKRAGAGKVFELEGTTRAKMNNYMQSHRSEIGYVSMQSMQGKKSAKQEVAGALKTSETESRAIIIKLKN